MSLLDQLLTEHPEEPGTDSVTPVTPQKNVTLQPQPLPHKAVTPVTPQKNKGNPESGEPLKFEQQQARQEDLEELFHERAAIAEYDGGLSREAAEELAIRTVWRWAINTGDAGTYRSNATSYEQARQQLERQFLGRTVTHLEFISAMAEGFGFIDYQPEGERHANHS